MEDLLGLVIAAFCWRVFVSASIAAAVAIFLVNTVAPFSGVQGIALFFVGVLAGFAWHGHAHGGPLVEPATTARKTSTPVAALAFIFGGSVWGLLSSTSAAAALLGLTLLIAFAGGLYAMRNHALGRHVSAAHASLYFCCAVVGFVAPVAFVNLNA